MEGKPQVIGAPLVRFFHSWPRADGKLCEADGSQLPNVAVSARSPTGVKTVVFVGARSKRVGVQ